MMDRSLGAAWSERFGLARSPMFSAELDGIEGVHEVLLDGGYGSFGLSVVNELGSPTAAAGWAWSSDLPHHVTVSPKDVQVVRWDAARDAQVYSLDSVSRDLDGFYRYLCRDRLRSNRTVVQHLITLFGRVRALVAHARLPDERAIDAFVTVLGDLISDGDGPAQTTKFGLPEDAEALRAALAGPALEQCYARNSHSACDVVDAHPTSVARNSPCGRTTVSRGAF